MTKEDIMFNLRQGLTAEYLALEMCEALLNVLEDEAEKGIILHIKKDEEKHIKITENLIELTEKHHI